jgi:Ca-activated chloride channel family protein
MAAGIRTFSADGQSCAGGTAIFDSIYRACFNQFRTLDSTDSGNFILLFTDGEDNASRTSLDEAVAMWQRTNTAIYIFRAEPETGFSTGSRTLAELASKSGGRGFYDDDSDAAIYSNIALSIRRQS